MAEETYSKAELDRIFEIIALNTSVVKEMLIEHKNTDEKKFEKLESEIDTIKKSSSEKVYNILMQVVMMLLGGGLAWVIKK